MHLTVVHTSSYYSGAPTVLNTTTTMLNTTTTSPSLNMTMASRVLRHCTSCAITNGTTLQSTNTLHARSNIDAHDNQGMHASAIGGIVFGVILAIIGMALLTGWAVRSNRAAFANSGNRRGQVRRINKPSAPSYGNPYEGHGANYGLASHQYYNQGEYGVAAPARSHSRRERSRGTALVVPGPRNGFASVAGSSRSGKSSKHSTRSARSHGSARSAAPSQGDPASNYRIV